MAGASHLSVVRNAEPNNGDPIFDVIERHRLAYAQWSAAVNREFELEGKDEARFIEAKAVEQKARADMDNAVCALVQVKPTTIEGVVALLRYYAEHAALGDASSFGEDFDVPVAIHVANALERITRSA